MQEFGRRFIFVILLLPEILFAMFAQRKEGFPSGGKKTASSLSRQRLMRGDKFPPKQRLQNLTRSTRQRSAASRPIGGVDRRILKSPQKTLRTLWGATKNGKWIFYFPIFRTVCSHLKNASKVLEGF